MAHKHHDDDEDEDEEYEDESHGQTGGFLMGLVFGGLIGLGAALLLAPASGEDTRQMLRQRAMEARDEARDKAEQARAKAKELENSSREMLEAQKQRVARTAEAVRQSAQQAWNAEGDNGQKAAGQGTQTPAQASTGQAEAQRPHA